MAITSTCGHHCGIRSTAEGTRAQHAREGHCGCPECECPQLVIRPGLSELDARVPMCERSGRIITGIENPRLELTSFGFRPVHRVAEPEPYREYP